MSALPNLGSLISRLGELLRSDAKDALLVEQLRPLVPGPEARQLLESLHTTPAACPARLLRALQCLALTAQPIRTLLNVTTYEWAGGALQALFHTDARPAEFWPFFSGPGWPAAIADTALNGLAPLTMEQLVQLAPEILGPNGSDPDNGGQKYFFVKFLDPSDFPPFAYVGFDPEAVARLRQTPSEFQAHLASLLWEDRDSLEAFARCARPKVTTLAAFEQLKAAYKRWAIAQAAANWRLPVGHDIALHFVPFIEQEAQARIGPLLTRMQRVRQQIVSLMHRVDFEDDQAILIETPTLHAIAGLSLQIHPKAPGNFYPKDELWIYKRLLDGAGRSVGWILVEPQRTFDKTESGADFFTPFAWTQGRLDFRKPITKPYLDQFVSLMDATPYPKQHFIRKAAPASIPGRTATGAAQWYRTVDEPSWPYFVVHELRFLGTGEASASLDHHSFVELHVTQGTVAATLSGPDISLQEFRISPAQPALLPASLPHHTITFRAQQPAQLQYFSRRLTTEA